MNRRDSGVREEKSHLNARSSLGAAALLLFLQAIGLLLAAPSVFAESGYDAWLRYAYIDDQSVRQSYDSSLPAVVVALDDSAIIHSARDELLRGVRGMLGRTLRIENRLPDEDSILLGNSKSISRMDPAFSASDEIGNDGYVVRRLKNGPRSYIVIAGTSDRGVLYGAFAFLRKIALHQPIGSLDETQAPFAPLRLTNQWDNLDGTIERGYGGPSIFFENNNVVKDFSRIRDYARLMASIGINGCSINNVNANTRIITAEFIPQVARVADTFRPWGVKLFVSVDFSSPQKIGGLDTFDPLDPKVQAWWKNKADEIYGAIPDFGGFVLKADSEGRVGPSTYGRSHADAANAIARGLKPHGGILFYRGFVYDMHADWRNLKNDRASAAYNNFKKLDGAFDDNVVLQIKNGPIDFQVREPVSPLLGALEKTNEAVELQVTQEYTGQQRHLCFLVPMWKEVLDFDMHARGSGTPVKDLAAGKTFNRPVGAFIGVTNVGSDPNWLGHHLAMANLYGFGRLAWNPDLSSKQIAEEWTELTFGHDPDVVKAIVDMQLASWPAYEDYTGPLGAGTLTDILQGHYGPNVEASERNGWGQWHRADHDGIGMERTVEDGTGFIGQYRPPVAAMYDSLKTCPDELLLFMHHVPYTYVLHSGRTVIQHIYDTHYEGAACAQRFVTEWQSLKHKIDEQRYNEVLGRLEYQAGHAQVWRDAVCDWFLHESGIPDAKGRAGHFPGRTEAESMMLDGYQVVDVAPWGEASAGKAVNCPAESRECSASFLFKGQPGWYDLRVQYFDQNNGVSHFTVYVAGQRLDKWKADDRLPTAKINGSSSTRHTLSGIALRPGDEIVIKGIPDGEEGAPFDYIELLPISNGDH